MMLETFKTLAQIAEARNFQVGFDTKKHMIEVVASFDEDGQINYDNDCHWTIYVGETCYTDEEITPALLKKACYIEYSWGDGWSFYIGRNCTQAVLESAFENTLGWALECGAEFGELTDAQLDTIEAAGVELEFAARNREWNAEEAEAIAADLMAEIETKRAEDASKAEQAEQEAAAKAEANEKDAERAAELEDLIAASIKAKEEAPAQIQVVIHAGYEYVSKPVASLEEAAALKAEYRAKTPEFDRFSFKCFDPAKVQFDRWGDIIAGGYEV